MFEDDDDEQMDDDEIIFNDDDMGFHYAIVMTYDDEPLVSDNQIKGEVLKNGFTQRLRQRFCNLSRVAKSLKIISLFWGPFISESKMLVHLYDAGFLLLPKKSYDFITQIKQVLFEFRTFDFY